MDRAVAWIVDSEQQFFLFDPQYILIWLSFDGQNRSNGIIIDIIVEIQPNGQSLHGVFLNLNTYKVGLQELLGRTQREEDLRIVAIERN